MKNREKERVFVSSSVGPSDTLERHVLETVDQSETVLSCSAIVDGEHGEREPADGWDAIDLLETASLSLQSLLDQG